MGLQVLRWGCLTPHYFQEVSNNVDIACSLVLDTSVLDYQCVVELCKKAQGECNGLTPPVCGRGKRSVDKLMIMKANKTYPITRRVESNRDNELDLVVDMNVLDTLDEELGQSGVPQDLLDRLNSRSTLAYHPRGILAAEGYPSDRMCMSTHTFGIMMAITVILFLTAVVTSAFTCIRVRSYKA